MRLNTGCLSALICYKDESFRVSAQPQGLDVKQHYYRYHESMTLTDISLPFVQCDVLLTQLPSRGHHMQPNTDPLQRLQL